MRTRLIIALLLTVLAAAALWSPGAGLKLRIDSSSAAIGASQAADTERLLASIRVSGEPDPAQLLVIDALVQRLKAMPAVKSVQSAIDAQLPFSSNDEIEVSSLGRRLRRNEPDPELWIQRMLNDPILAGRLLSADQRSFALVIQVLGQDEASRAANTALIVETMREQLSWDPRLEFRISGAPLIKQTIGKLLMEQMLLVLPISIGAFAVLLWSAFRRLAVVLACMVTMAVSMVWTLAIAAALGWGLNLVTILIPPLVLALSVAYSMHLVSEFAAEQDSARALKSVRGPLCISGLTTAIGLGALAFNPLYSIQQFAALGALAAITAVLASELVLGGLLLGIRSQPSIWPSVDSLLVKCANRLAEFAVSNAKLVLLVGVTVLVAALLAATQVQPGARYIRDLPLDNPARADFEHINAAFDGTNTFNIDLQASGADAALLPNVLHAVSDLQIWLAQQPEVGGSLSLADFVKRVNQTFGSGTAEDYRIPHDAALIKQMMLIAAPADVYAYTDQSFTRIRIEVSSPEVDTAVLSALFQRLQPELDALPPGLTISLNGPALELTQTIESLTKGQLQSVALASLAILLVLCLMFASIKVGLLAMLPNILPVAIYFGLLGVTGTALGPTTALVACIVLGIAVDDTLHMLVRFNRLAREFADEQRAARLAAAQIIRPITLTTVAVCCGFLSLLFSPFHSQVVFGAMAAATLVVAWASDLLLVPAVGSRATIVTLWDSLKLDLGQTPEKTIPLLAGMRPRQARLFALSTSIRELPAGELLIRQGEDGREMFVVVEGQLKVWVERPDGTRMELGTVSRGATLGEGGSFNSRRTANVQTLGPVRLLVFTADDLERLRKRHSKIGALAYRNLNQIQAQRLAGTTERLALLGERTTDARLANAT